MLKYAYSRSVNLRWLKKTFSNTRFLRVTVQGSILNRRHSTRSEKSLNELITDLKAQSEKRSRLSHYGLDNVAEKLEMQPVDSAQSLSIIQCCLKAHIGDDQIEIIGRIWNEMKMQNIFNVQHYTEMMRFYRNKQMSNEVERIFDEMIDANVKPNVVAYRILLSAYCENGNIEKVNEVLSTMSENGMSVNERCFNSLIQCYTICGNIEDARIAYTVMKNAQMNPDFYTLEKFLNFYAERGDIENIKKTFNDFDEEKVKLQDNVVSNAMCELIKNGHFESIDELLPRLKSTDISEHSYRNIITALTRTGEATCIQKIITTLKPLTENDAKYLIEEMIRLNVDADFFSQVVENLHSIGITIEKNYDVYKVALEGPSTEITQRILAHMKSQKMNLNENHFTKLFQLTANEDIEKTLEIIQLMCSECGIQPRITFIRDVILPGLKVTESSEIPFRKLGSVKLKLSRTVVALVNECINNGNLATAYEIARKFDLYYGNSLVTRQLIRAYGPNTDMRNYAKLIKLVLDSFEHYQSYIKGSDGDPNLQKRNFFDDVLKEAASKQSSNETPIKPLLKAFVSESICLSAEQADEIRKSLGTKSKNSEYLLMNLTSEVLLLRKSRAKKHQNNTNSSSEIKKKLETTIISQNVNLLTKKLFYAYLAEMNVNEAESLIASKKIELTDSDQAQLIRLYIDTRNLEKALNTLEQVQDNRESFKLDSIKVSKLISLMIDTERDFNEIETILIKNKSDEPQGQIFIERILNELATAGNSKMLHKLYETAIKTNFIEASLESTRPLIEVHLLKEDLVNAVDSYQYVCETYKFSPLTQTLMCKLIEKMELDLLECVIDAHRILHSNDGSAAQLAFAYVKCGRAREAKFIFGNGQIKNISEKLKKQCKHYEYWKDVKAVQTLLSATKEIDCDRSIIYETLLNIYYEKNDIKGALDLWREYADEINMMPTKFFMTRLTSLMEMNDIPNPLGNEIQLKNVNTILEIN